MATDHGNNLNAGMRCIKYMLFIINFMFVLTAILLIIVGTTIQSIFGSLEVFIDDHFVSPPALLVAVGVIILIVATFGCVGAIRESTFMINIYGVLLAIIFILEVAAAISAFALHNQVSSMLYRTMDRALSDYYYYPHVAEAVDFMQNALECCGIQGPDDWERVNQNYNGEGLSSINNTVVVPDSCCRHELITTDECSELFENGCFNTMNYIISQSAMLIATGATTVAFVQILGVICAFMLAKTIRRTKSLRAARRYQLQQSFIGPVTEKNHFTQPYTQMSASEKTNDPILYVPNSPSVN